MADPALADFINRLRILHSIDADELIERGPDSITAYAKNEIWQSFRVDPVRWLLKASDVDVEHVWSILQRRSRTFPVIGRFRVGERVAFASAAAAHLNNYDPTIVRTHVVYSVQCEGQRGPMDESYTDSQLRGPIDNG